MTSMALNRGDVSVVWFFVYFVPSSQRTVIIVGQKCKCVFMLPFHVEQKESVHPSGEVAIPAICSHDSQVNHLLLGVGWEYS